MLKYSLFQQPGYGPINEELLKSAKLTGLWENKLRKIERNEYTAADFISELKNMVSKIVIDVLKDNSHSSIPLDNDNDNKKKPKK